MQIEQVKTDLRELKKTVHLIDTLVRAKNAYAYRIKSLIEQGSKSGVEEARKLQEKLDDLKIQEHITRAIELQGKYTEAISALGVVDKTIVLEYYINGTSAWKIGNKLGYSEDGIRKRLAKALAQIAKAI